MICEYKAQENWRSDENCDEDTCQPGDRQLTRQWVRSREDDLFGAVFRFTDSEVRPKCQWKDEREGQDIELGDVEGSEGLGDNDAESEEIP